MKINIYDYTLAAILPIMTLENKIYLIVFYFYTFNSTKFNFSKHSGSSNII